MRAFVLMCLIALSAAGQPARLGSPDAATRPAVLLPKISISFKGNLAPDPRIDCTVVFATDKPATPAMPAQVHIRGATSQVYPKKSLALIFGSPVSILQMPRRRHWILNAAYIDRSMMRHKLTYDLFRSIATAEQPRYAAESRFVEVELNGQYHGLYLLMERVDSDMLPLGHAWVDEPDQPCLFKAVDHESGFIHTDSSGFVQQHPDPVTLEYADPLVNLMRVAVTGKPIDLFRREGGINSVLDVDNAIDFHLLVLLTGNADGITKNFYLARPKPQLGSPCRFFFVPWDYDGTFGQNWDSSKLPADLWLSNNLYDRMLQNQDYRAKFSARWKQLREGPFADDRLLAMIDANRKEIAEAMVRNNGKWPTDIGFHHGRVSFDQDVEMMKSWIPRHTSWLDRTITRRYGAGNARPGR